MNYLYSALFLVTPLLMFHKTSELFEFNKMLFIYLISGAVATIWLSRMIVHKRIILKNTLFSPLLLAFLSSQILSTVFSIDKWTSFFGYYGRFNGGLLSIIAYIVLYQAFVSNFSGDQIKKAVHNIFNFSLIGSVLVMLWGLPSKFGYDFSCLLFTGNLDVGCWTEQFKPTIRVFSTLGQPNWFGAYLAINFFIGLYFYTRAARNNKRVPIYAVYMLLTTIMLFYTRSRSTLLAVAAGLIMFMLYIFVKHRKKLVDKAFRMPIGLLIVSMLSAVIIAKTGISSIDKLIPFSSKQPTGTTQQDVRGGSVKEPQNLLITDSFTIRKIVWHGGYTLGLKYPFFGTGVETYAYAYNFVRPTAHNNTSEWDYVYNKAHNEFINYFATTGFIGLGTYTLFLGVVLSQVVYILRKKNDLSTSEELVVVTCLSAFITIIVTNFFGFSITVTNLYLYILPACMISITSKKLFELPQKNTGSLSTQQKRMLMGTAVGMVLCVVYVMRYFFADVDYAYGDNLSNVQDYGGSLNKLYSAYNARNEHVYADKISSVLAQLALIQASTEGDMNCVSHKNELKPCPELVAYYEKVALDGSPMNPLYYRTISRNGILLYQATGDESYFNTAVEALHKARQLAPTDPRYPYTLALFYLAKIENTKSPTQDEVRLFENKALPTIDFAIQLKPDYRDGIYAKVLILKQLKRNAEAKQLIESYLDTYNASDEQFIEERNGL